MDIIQELNEKIKKSGMRVELQLDVPESEIIRREDCLVSAKHIGTVFALLKDNQVVFTTPTWSYLITKMLAKYGDKFSDEQGLLNLRWKSAYEDEFDQKRNLKQRALQELNQKLCSHQMSIKVEDNIDPEEDGGLIDIRNLDDGEQTFSVYTLVKEGQIIARETSLKYLIDEIQKIYGEKFVRENNLEFIRDELLK